MRFDPQGGFDAEARAAIAALLPPGADASSAIAALEMAGRFYINIKRRKPRKAAAERKHYDEGAKWLAWLIAWLVHEAERDPWPKQYIEMCAAVDREVTKRRALWAGRAHISKGRADPDLDLFYFQIIDTWHEAGGKLARASTKTGGPAAHFLRTVAELIGHKLSVDGARKVVGRFAADYKDMEEKIKRYRKSKSPGGSLK